MRYFEHLIEFKMVLNSLLMKKEERRSDWAIRSNLEADRVVRFSFLGRWFVWESDKTEKNDGRTWKKDIKRKISSPFMPVAASDAAPVTFGRREKCRLEKWPLDCLRAFYTFIIFHCLVFYVWSFGLMSTDEQSAPPFVDRNNKRAFSC